MADEKMDDLKQRIAELEEEVVQREEDLKRFRDELTVANSRLEKLVDRIGQEVKLAHVIQKTLVPTEFPHISGFEFSTKFLPSSIAGGDYFDIFEHQDRFRFGVILSSCSGHTMSALLLSVLLKMTSQLESRRGSDPHQVLEEMYAQLAPHLTPPDQADLFYALVDRRNYEMRYVRSSSVVVLHQSFQTGVVQTLDSGLGVLQTDFLAPLQSSSLMLNPRDRMVLCTRGLTDAKNAGGEVYGLEGVTRSFLTGPKRGVHELRNHVLFELQTFTGNAEPQRDQTVIVLEVKDKVIKLAKG